MSGGFRDYWLKEDRIDLFRKLASVSDATKGRQPGRLAKLADEIDRHFANQIAGRIS